MAEQTEEQRACDARGKRAPVQGFAAGIPWSLHLRAYDAYCKQWGPYPALLDLEGRGCRGGFSCAELDVLVPGWRDEESEIGKLRGRVAALIAERDAARQAHERLRLSLLRQMHGFDFIKFPGCPQCKARWRPEHEQHAPGCPLAPLEEK